MTEDDDSSLQMQNDVLAAASNAPTATRTPTNMTNTTVPTPVTPSLPAPPAARTADTRLAGILSSMSIAGFTNPGRSNRRNGDLENGLGGRMAVTTSH